MAGSHGAGDQFGDILGADLLLHADALAGILEHTHAEGAGGGQGAGTSVGSLLHPRVVDARANMLLHEDASAATAAAKALLAVARHLFEADTGNGGQDLARRVIFVVVAAQVAGIMVGHFLVNRVG